jgi:hypothetical protein
MWKLSPEELRQLLGLIGSAYASAGLLRVMLALEGHNLDDLTTPTATLPETILSVVLRAQADGWLPDLVEAIKRDQPGRADIQAFTLPVPDDAPVAGSDPYEDWVVRRNKVLVDREPLRDAVRNLEQTNAYRFLVVTGEEKTGKTYSRHFITHIFERRRTFELGWINLVDLYRPATGPLTPEPIAERLFSYLRLDPALVPAKDDEKYERWSQRACDALIRALPAFQPGAPRVAKWLMLDGFNSVPVHDGTIAFVEEVSRHVEATLTDVRLILLGWKGVLPEDAEDLALRETVMAISDQSLKDFFQRVHKQRAPALSDSDLAKAVAQSVANVKRAVQPGIARINVALGDAVAHEWSQLKN